MVKSLAPLNDSFQEISDDETFDNDLQITKVLHKYINAVILDPKFIRWGP